MAQSCFDKSRVSQLREVTTAQADELVLQDVRWYRDLGICQVGSTEITDVDQLGQVVRGDEVSYRVAIDTAGVSFVRGGEEHPRNPQSIQVLVLRLELSAVWRIADIEPT